MIARQIFAKKLLTIAQETQSNQERMIDLFLEIEDCFNRNIYSLDDVLEDAAKYVTDENISAMTVLQDVCEQLSFANEVYGADGTPYRASIFAMPIVFVQQKGTILPELTKYSTELDKIVKSFKQTKVFPQECNLYLHNKLYAPEQLTGATYNQVHDMYIQMRNIFCNLPHDFKKVEFPTFDEPPLPEDTLQLRYLIGLKMHKHDLPIESSEEIGAHMKAFNEKISPILTKILDGFSLNVVTVDDFFEGTKVGLEFYTSLTRRLDMEKIVADIDEPIASFEAILDFDFDNFGESKIELKSKVKDVIGEFKMYALPFQNTEDLTHTIAYELEDFGLSMEDVYVRIDGELIPITTIIDYDPKAEQEVINFLNETDI